MEWRHAISEQSIPEKAARHCMGQFNTDSRIKFPTACLVFMSGYSFTGQKKILNTIQEKLPKCVLIGCSGMGVFAQEQIINDSCGVLISALFEPGVKTHSFYINSSNVPDLDTSPMAWVNALGEGSVNESTFFVFSEPEFLFTEQLLSGLDYAFPGSKCGGGWAGALRAVDSISLYHGNKIYHNGAVGLRLEGIDRFHSVSSPGYRKIGKQGIITRSEANRLEEVDSIPALDYICDLYHKLNREEQENHSILAGVFTENINKVSHSTDYSIREIVHINPLNGTITLSDCLHVGQQVQFLIRESDLALKRTGNYLADFSNRKEKIRDGFLIYSAGCEYGRQGFSLRQAELWNKSDIPLSGFIGRGEISTVNGQSVVQEYTSTIHYFH